MKKIVKYFCIAALAVTAVLFTGCFGFDERPEDGGGEFVPVERIDGIPAVSVPYIAISLSGTVMPENATNKKAEWSVKTDGGTNSKVEGSRLTANGEGTVTVTATIKNGKGEGVDYTQDFSIVISLSAPYAVKDILGIPSTLPMGSHEIKGRVAPSNASYQNIVWSVVNDGGTGAAITPAGLLTAPSRGTVTIRATVVNGLLQRDFTQDFEIFISRTGVVASGYRSESFLSNTPMRACYWIDGVKTDLDVPVGTTFSYTIGIVYIGSSQYIAGYYQNGVNNVLCYWKDGVRTDLSNGTGASGYNDTTQSYAIAADGSDIYITGIVANAPYYWKIEGGSETGARTNLPLPSPSTTNNYFTYNGCFVVNNGTLYIPFRYSRSRDGSTTVSSYYWSVTNGTPATNQITSNFRVDCIAVVSGKMYMGGCMDAGYDDLSPAYWQVNTTDLTPIELYDKYLDPDLTLQDSDSIVKSILDQNGKLLFFGSNNGTMFSYWDAGGNRTRLKESVSQYSTETVFYFDGDVYIAMLSSTVGQSGYMRLGGEFIKLGTATTFAIVTGFAVIP